MECFITASIILPVASEVSPPAQKCGLPWQNGHSMGMDLGQGLQRVELLVKAATLVYSRHSTEIRVKRQGG